MHLKNQSLAILLTFATTCAVVPRAIARDILTPNALSDRQDDAATRLRTVAQPVYCRPNSNDVTAAAEHRDAREQDLESKVEHLRGAAKHLKAAGKTDLARQLDNEALLEEKLEQIQRLQSEIAELRGAAATDRIVTLHVKIMELQVTKMRKLGIDFQTADGVVIDLIDHVTRDMPGKVGPPIGLLSALQANALIKVLAEPTLVTLSGHPASVQSGGEFPIVVPQGDGDVGVEHRQFGTRLDCVAEVLDSGRIRLELHPSVSEIDASRSVMVQGTSVPGLRTRSFDTAVEMEAGQTLVLSGLTQSRPKAEGDSSEIEETALLVSVTANLDEPVKHAEMQRANERR
jgi:Flp pilus assembly secretin CpaC